MARRAGAAMMAWPVPVGPGLPARWDLLGAAVVLALATGAGLWTHDPIADGPFAVYARGLAVAAGATVWVWAMLAAQFGPRSAGPLLAGLVVFGAASGLHYWRLSRPLLHGAPVVALASSFAGDLATEGESAPWRRQWDVETSGGGMVAPDGGALRLTSVPGGVAYVRAKVPPSAPPAAWWLPVGMDQLTLVETATWRAAVLRQAPYLGIVQSGRLSVQVVEHGLLISAPDATGDVRATLVHERFPSDSQPHRWTLTANGQTVTLAVDGRRLWAAPRREGLDELRLGETRAEAGHGGVLLLHEASFTRRFVRRTAMTPL
ncbi:MAG: hypothetical protein ACRDI2_21190 [Chloroflexota bacterium]